jgi:hypothetical protein
MSAKTRPNQLAAVVHLDNFRHSGAIEAGAHTAVQSRIELIRGKVEHHLYDATASPVATAFVSIHSDGSVRTFCGGIEQEMAETFAVELENLAKTIRAHGRKPAKNSRQRGSAALTFVTTVAFCLATYVNETAWIDAILMFAAQALTAWITRRPPPPN